MHELQVLYLVYMPLCSDAQGMLLYMDGSWIFLRHDEEQKKSYDPRVGVILALRVDAGDHVRSRKE